MKRTSAALKLLARESLSGKYGTLIAALILLGMCSFLPAMLITSIMDTTTVLGIITSQVLVYGVSLLVSLISAGYSKMLLNMTRQESFDIKDLFYIFTHYPDRFLIVHLILLVIQFVVCLPLNLPGYMDTGNTDMQILLMTLLGSLLGSLVSLVLGLFFGLTDYLLLDNPDMGAIEAMRESARLMKGNKGRYFYINLSFLPLYMISLVSCYIGLLWLEPYMRTTMVYFYRDVTGELDRKAENPEPQIFTDDHNSTYDLY